MKRTLLVCFISVLVVTGYAQTDPALVKYMDTVFKEFNNKNSPGCAVTILHNGKPIAQKAYGMASIELQVPFTQRSVVKIGYSEAREFIAIAAILMEKDGILSLNDKLKKYFPKLPEWSEPVTIWDLLNHRSGFVDEWATLLMMHADMANRFDKEQFFRLMYTQPEAEVEPGKGYMYCNSDFGLLRLLMEKASGKNLSDWIRQRIFDPLKMNNTSMQKNPLDIIPNKANKYSKPAAVFKNVNVQKTSPGGNYYILTCADDLAKWSIAIGDPSSEFHSALNKLFANVRKIPGKKDHYVTGHSLDTINGNAVVIHEGVNGENYLTRIPAKGYAIITLGNIDYNGFSDQNKLLRSYILKEKKPAFVKPIFAKKPIVVAEADLQQYTGKYRWLNQVSWESVNEIRKFSDFFIENGKLRSRYSGNYMIDLTPVGKDLFYYEDGFGMEIRFTPATNTTLMSVTASFDDGWPPDIMEKKAAQAWKPTKDELAKFAGRYYSKHLDYYWNLEMNEQGKMVLKRATVADIIMEPDGENEFYYSGEKYAGAPFDQWILFNKDVQGNISGFTVSSARVMHHRFDKVQ